MYWAIRIFLWSVTLWKGCSWISVLEQRVGRPLLQLVRIVSSASIPLVSKIKKIGSLRILLIIREFEFFIGSTIPKDDVDLIDVQSSLSPSPIRQIKALLRKRIWHFRKDWFTFLAGLLLPTMFVAVAMGFSLIRPPSEDEPSLALTPKLYNTHPTYFYRYSMN